MFGFGLGGWLITVVISWFIQRSILKGVKNESLAETLFVVLWIPGANVILSIVFYLAKEGQVTPDWIRKNVYQVKD